MSAHIGYKCNGKGAATSPEEQAKQVQMLQARAAEMKTLQAEAEAEYQMALLDLGKFGQPQQPEHPPPPELWPWRRPRRRSHRGAP